MDDFARELYVDYWISIGYLRSRRLHSVCTKERMKHIKGKMLKNPTRSENEIAAEGNMSRRTMQIIINRDSSFCPYLERKVEGLTAAQILKRLQICKKMLNWHDSECIGKIISPYGRLL